MQIKFDTEIEKKKIFGWIEDIIGLVNDAIQDSTSCESKSSLKWCSDRLIDIESLLMKGGEK